jgi:phosphoglycolate phosphatase
MPDIFMDLLIFDLDGTLIDSKLDLAHSVNAARAHLGMPPIEHELVFSYVGNGAPVLMRRSLGPEATEQQLEEGLAFFLSYYRDHMLDYTLPYPGVPEALKRLHAAGKHMAVLTNKPVRISRDIVRGLGFGNYFFQVYGGNSFEQKKPEPQGVYALLEESQTSAQRAILVGDSAVDVQTARNAQIAVCGVSYGFQPESFEQHPPDFIVDDMQELAEMVLAGRLDKELLR